MVTELFWAKKTESLKISHFYLMTYQYVLGKFIRHFPGALQSETPKCKVELDSQMFPIHLRIKQKKLPQIRKTMAKPEVNIKMKHPLQNGPR